MKRSHEAIMALCIFLMVVIADRISKYYALLCLDVPCEINNNLSFVLHFNRGISWGLLHSQHGSTFFFVSFLICVLVLSLTAYTYWRWLHNYSIFAEMMVLAGALSNVIDRFVYKGVVDFILLSASGWAWPVFNIADIFIVLGVGIMFLTGLNE